MLLPCPECGREVSDRAKACPTCGFPIVDELAAKARDNERTADVESRTRVGEVDCPDCNARGFVMTKIEHADGSKGEGFLWCAQCQHSGRVHLFESTRGSWAVAMTREEAFIEGATAAEDGIAFLGNDVPAGHRYDTAGRRHSED